jgi:hypothetical protein
VAARHPSTDVLRIEVPSDTLTALGQPAPSTVLWWAPWPPNLLVLPLILVTLLFAVAGVRWLLGQLDRARRVDRAPAS